VGPGLLANVEISSPTPPTLSPGWNRRVSFRIVNQGRHPAVTSSPGKRTTFCGRFPKHYWSLDTGNGHNERGTLDNTGKGKRARICRASPPGLLCAAPEPRREACRRSGDASPSSRLPLLPGTALANKRKDTLKIYFPQIPLWFENVSTDLVSDLLAKWPTLEDLQKARPATLEKFFRRHQYRDQEKIAERIEQIKNAAAATRDEAWPAFSGVRL
jgi:hypothetical protein